jgi:hypothetical protein
MVKVVSKIHTLACIVKFFSKRLLTPYFMKIFGNSTKHAQSQTTRTIRGTPQTLIILHMESYPDSFLIFSMALNVPMKIWNSLFVAPSLVYI